MNPSAPEERSYIAFISYRHLPLDREAAVRIQKRIENYVVPKEYRERTGGKKLGVCFRDEDELPASSSLSDSITYALDHTEYLIVICTPDLPKSRWCLQEVRYFLQTHDRDHVLAVLADGRPEESFPDQLRFLRDDEGKVLSEIEPLAANIAGPDHKINNKTFKKEAARLIAAILGCPFDALWQRERRTRTNKLIAGMGVGLAAMAVVMGLVLSKNAQISRQNTQISEQNEQIKEQLDQISEQNEEIKEQYDKISTQSEQIEKQNTELQKQVSSVLVNSGRMQLDAFDRTAALESALQALESGDPAIYDHNAELLLADALGVYGCQQPQYDILFEQNTDITNLVLSEDGSTVFTCDDSGVVRALFSEDATLQWEQSLGGSGAPLLTPLKDDRPVLCKTRESLWALSVQDGSVIWSRNFNYCRFHAVSPDQSVVAVLAKETYDSPITLYFFDIMTGETLLQPELPLEEFELSDRGTYCYEYGGAFSADSTRFVCMIPCYKGADYQEYSGFFMADLRDGSVTPLASFDGSSRTVLAMEFTDDDTVYCAFATAHTLFSALIPCDPALESTTHSYDYSRASAVGLPGSVTEGEAGWVEPLYSDDLAILFCRNKIYQMGLADGSMHFNYDLESAVIAAEWLDRGEEIFQVVTESGMCIRYDVSHEGESAFRNLYGDSTSLSHVTEAVLIHDGFFCDPENGCTLMVSKDAPRDLVAIQTVTDPSIEAFAENGLWQQSWSVQLSPSGTRTFVYLNTDDDSYILAYDTASGELLNKHLLPSSVDFSAVVFPDDDHFLYRGVLYGLDGSEETVSPEISYVSPEAMLLSDGKLLFARDIPADYGTRKDPEVRVFSYQYGDDRSAQHYDLRNGICMQQNSSFAGPAYLFSAGRNGWLAGYGLYTYVDENHIQQITETPSLVVQNVSTGEKMVLDFTYEEQAVTRFAFADHSPLMAVETEDGQILLYDLETGSFQILSDSYAFGEIDAICFSNQDDLLFVYTSTSRLDGYDLETGEMVCSIEKPFADAYSVSGLHWFTAESLPGDRVLLSGCQYYGSGWAALLDTDAMVLVARIKNYHGYSAASEQVLIKTGQELSRCPVHSLDTLMRRAEELIYGQNELIKD